MDCQNKNVKINDTNYVDKAEGVIKNLEKCDDFITKSKIRNLLTLMNEVYGMVQHDTNDEIGVKIKSRLQYIKMRFAYEAGREDSVKNFINEADMLNNIDLASKGNRNDVIRLCHYMEALVAYHRFSDKCPSDDNK